MRDYSTFFDTNVTGTALIFEIKIPAFYVPF
jgi:hypothetical protein